MTGELTQALRHIDTAWDTVSERGWAIVPTGVRDRDTTVVLLEHLGTQLGGVIPHTEDGPIADVTVLEQFNDRSVRRPQSDSGPQFPHTDAVLSTELPSILAMACLGRAQEGGRSVLVDLRPFLAEYGPHGVLDPLFDPEAVTIERAKIFRQVSVLRRRDHYIDVAFSDHEYNYTTPKADCVPAFTAMRAYAASEVNQHRIALDSGDLLLVANRFCLHGREAFNNGPLGVRHLVRAWYRGTLSGSDGFEGYSAEW